MKRKILAPLLTAVVIFGSAFEIAAKTLAQEATLYINPQCECCEGYAKYLRENGFSVTVKPTHQLVAMSREVGLPEDFQGCHLSLSMVTLSAVLSPWLQ